MSEDNSMNQPEQMSFPFACDTSAIQRFITSLYAIHTEEEALREQKRMLRQQAKDEEYFPVRAVETALKRVLAQRKLETHKKEPMSRLFQGLIEHIIEDHIETLEAEIRDIPSMI